MSRLLLDTHIALWAITDDHRLSGQARSLIGRSDAHVLVSVISLWEIAIKFALRRERPGDMPVSATDARRYFELAGYDLLPITADHALAVARLTIAHGDPFDRMLVAQALHEPLVLMTHDKRVAAYSNGFLLV